MITRMTRACALLLATALGLSGCASEGEDRGNLLLETGGAVFQSVRARAAGDTGPAPKVQITAQQLANTKVAALQVNPEKQGGSDFLRRIAQRRDDTPGIVAVWRASDNAQLFIRNGVLVGTRGVGNDIISSDATPTVLAVAGARAGRGERRYFVSDGGYGQTEVVLSCDIANLGAEPVQIVNLAFQTVHLRETCVGGAADRVRIVNDYWVQPGSGTVRKSRQWAGPLAGHFELLLLKD